MTRIVGTTLAFLAAGLTARAGDDRGPPPARQLEALLKEYEDARQRNVKEYEAAREAASSPAGGRRPMWPCTRGTA